MRILVIGGTGLLGNRLAEKARDAFEVHATYHRHAVRSPNFHRLDITSRRAVEGLLEELSPGAVVNTAAFHQVDRCETDRNSAKAVNFDAAVNLAEGCAKIGAHCVYLSTEYVFDGKKGAPYLEDDEQNPLSYYGETKAAAEKALLGKLGDNLVIRTSTVYGWNETKLNFATWALGELQAEREIRAASDQVGSPTFVDDLADSVLRAVELRKTGIYHVAGSEPMDRHSFTLLLAETFGLDKNLAKPVRSEELAGRRAKRPLYAPLDTRKAENDFGARMLNPKDGLLRMAGQKGMG